MNMENKNHLILYIWVLRYEANFSQGDYYAIVTSLFFVHLYLEHDLIGMRVTKNDVQR